ncbi:alpha/beta fold hydrolase [Nakamurella endophytica]|uniref:Alpha/beta hydrolase n=1 Tax=Nakamurella endophytica TaxID=1748367 RepID=A0A917WKH9_9ACTN|nr:alpha/beta fold hydrolase [Nakamurella endophytica]GGM12477.1 alpha/beta hydrolase [Nakamurella endophytica]
MDSYTRGDLTFPVLDRGPDDGPVTVLLHGFPQDARSWDRVVPDLHAAGLRTLAPAMRGYPASARPRRRRSYATRETVADLVALLDAAGVDAAHVVGHDWGGAVAWAAAGWHPDRIRSLTVLSTPHPAALATALLHSTQGLRSYYMALFQLPWLPELLVGLSLRRTLLRSGLPAADADRYVAQLADRGARTGALDWYRGMPFSLRVPVPDVTVPTTYVWGRSDFALGRAAAEATAGHVRGEYRFLELAGGHWLPETRPADVAAAVLARTGSVPGPR